MIRKEKKPIVYTHAKRNGSAESAAVHMYLTRS